MSHSKLLNILNLNLHGIKFIEASAGTGKTFALIIIYIRLLLHLHNQSKFAYPLKVEEILIVTFTKSAAESLRTRIRENIYQFRLDCIRKKSNNSLFSQLLLQIKDFDLAITRLSTAINKINQASIFTIHSFCQKIITQYTLELNIPFHLSIVEDTKSLYQQICNDVWRYYFYPLPINIISLIQTFWNNPTVLLKNILPYLHIDFSNTHYNKNVIHYNTNNIILHYEKILTKIKTIKKEWYIIQDNIIKTINSYNINRRKYNKKNLERWINIINQWIKKPTIDHTIPDVLKYFRSSELQIHIDYLNNQHTPFNICETIETFYKNLLSFKSFIFQILLKKIQENLKKNIYLKSEITYNDLVNILMNNLTDYKKNNLAHLIRISYPITIIDELQDTDTQQYKIFKSLYHNNPENCLILIGDPKQSIYAFRGADIFSYMNLRKTISNQYHLNINWRSSANMVNAINQLFQLTSNPFVFNDIPFTPSQPAHQNKMHQFLINNCTQPAIQFWLHPGKITTINEYKHAMAQECATTISYLLQQINKKTIWLTNYRHRRLLQTSDIVILIRNHDESMLMQAALSKINISSISLSHAENIFGTEESRELLLLLQAILFPNHRTILTALTTCFFPFNAIDIANINTHENKWGKILTEFMEYHLIWKQKGILLMIQKIILHYKTHKKLFSSQKNNKFKLINILHLSELLQNHAKNLNNEKELIYWLIKKIHKSKQEYMSDQLLRLDDDAQLIKISTIHKSKGLEFPIVFLPFIANFNHTKNPFFHNRQSYEICLNFNESKLYSHLIREECLSEDLRLLYVAITRSIYYCAIGIAPIIHKNKKQNNINDLHHSALGYLIQKKTAGDATFLRKQLQQLSIDSMQNISFRNTCEKKYNNLFISKKKISQPLSIRTWKKPKNLIIPWNMTSYSELITNTNNNTLKYSNNLNYLGINNNLIIQDEPDLLTPHTFPKGKICGEFFHKIFKVLNFQENLHTEWISNQLEKYNLNPIWASVVQKWIQVIINVPLDYKNLTLSSIQSNNKKTEINFYLPINTYITADKLDNLRKNYDPLSLHTVPLTFSKITGMLKGFIDLIFYWNHQYYLIDYKTNWLGIDNNSYTFINMKNEMIKHHYELQYQLYTVVLHRFLQHRIKSYKYEKNFGGIYYLFIRGINQKQPKNGILFFKPSSEFINKLDNMFKKT